MKLIFFFMTFFFSHELFSQTLDILWSDQFQKEIFFHCRNDDNLCEMLCRDKSFCGFQEGICKNCIGTGLKMNHILSELGKTIKNTKQVFSDTELKEFLLSGNFSTLGYRDVFNVIDTFESLRVLKKIESLCPEGSENQIVFLKLRPLMRDVQGVPMVFCELPEKSLFFHLSQDPVVEVYEKNYSYGDSHLK